MAEVIDRLRDDGPALGPSGLSEVWIMFIFDPVRSAVLLVAGDKSGRWGNVLGGDPGGRKRRTRPT